MTAWPSDDLPAWLAPVVAVVRESGPDLAVALAQAAAVGAALPPPGEGRTRERWAALAALARANVTVARVVEAHTDALAIRHEAGLDVGGPDTRTWGVFAAESADARVTASRSASGASDAGEGDAAASDAGEDGGHQTTAEMTLAGHKPWCSLGGVLDAALVTAWNGSVRQLFEIDLHHEGVRARPAAGWVSRGLPTVVSVGLDLEQVPARPVGAPGWYLERAGFAWGGMGVAACWWGAARGVADALAGARRDEIGALHAGRVDVALHAAACTLAAAADTIDAGEAGAGAGELLALRVRAVVADACELVLSEVGQATGPAPLAFDERHAAQVADLQIYLRQHHGARDVAALGARLRDAP